VLGAIFEHPVDLRWRDTDALGHVNHVVFLTYLEEGRDAFYTRILGGNPDYVVARLEIEFRAEIRLPDRRVLVQVQAEHLGSTSLITREKILTRPQEIAALARVVTVRWDPQARKAIRFSAEQRARLQAGVVPREERAAGTPVPPADPPE
jgi:acyl-CoA thioester hydrolase